ncbi:peroxisome biogenesis factor 10 [Collariella sp. IMI 366227]|nr:peroxisome biogenesis factor 10 [Collariella sp. IMI 366227]
MATVQPPPSRPSPPLTSSPYPYATAPDIIRAHQKDAYFQGVLANQLSDLHRRLRGARSAHAWATETRTFADALYLCLTTLLGNRTLGEEYCDLVQPTLRRHRRPLLPSLPAARLHPHLHPPPYTTSRLLPSVRTTLRKRLQSRLATLTRTGRDQHKTTGQPSSEYRVLRYLLTHLGSITSGATSAQRRWRREAMVQHILPLRVA